jgi:dGTPase
MSRSAASADYAWYSDWERARFWTGTSSQSPDDPRSDFERDRGRIIHSVAFRALQGKTQVFAPGTADFMRSRVTHSFEVSQIGRALAKRFGVPGSLVEAACLGHDLGHPPFGHTGEETLNELMEAYGGFEGNAQSFRIVTRIEPKSPKYIGLDLCRATLHGLLKYPYRRSAGHTKYLYDDDADKYAEWLFEGLDQRFLIEYTASKAPPRTLPCQLMDWADDIAYSVHDLEDGILSGLLVPSIWLNEDFLASLHKSVCDAPGIRWASGPPDVETITRIVEDLLKQLRDYTAPSIPRDVLREMTRHYIDRFATAGSVESVGAGSSAYDFVLNVPEEIRVENQVLKSITFEYVIHDARTTTIMYKGREILRSLFATLFEEAKKGEFWLFPRDRREELDSLKGRPDALARVICDDIATMTEGQAVKLYGRLFEPETGSPFAWT